MRSYHNGLFCVSLHGYCFLRAFFSFFILFFCTCKNRLCNRIEQSQFLICWAVQLFDVLCHVFRMKFCYTGIKRSLLFQRFRIIYNDLYLDPPFPFIRSTICSFAREIYLVTEGNTRKAELVLGFSCETIIKLYNRMLLINRENVLQRCYKI